MEGELGPDLGVELWGPSDGAMESALQDPTA